MRVKVVTTGDREMFCEGHKVTWRWTKDFLQVYDGKVLRLELPRRVVVAVALTEMN